MNPQDATSKPASPQPSLHDSQQLLHTSQLLLAGLGGADRPSGPPGLTATPTLGGLLAALRRRWLLAFTLALLGAGGFVAAVFLVLMPPKFAASIQVHVAEKGDPNLFGQNQDDTQFVIFKGTVLAKTINPKILSSALNEKTASGKDVKDLAIVRDKGAGAVGWLEKALKAHYNAGPETLTVSLSGDDPGDVADLLNAVGAALLKEFEHEQKAKRNLLIQGLHGKDGAAKEEIGRKRRQLDDRMKANGLIPNEAALRERELAERELTALDFQLTSVAQELNKANTKARTLDNQIKTLERIKAPDDKINEAIRNDPLGRQLDLRLANLQDTIDKYLAVANPNSPATQQFLRDREADTRALLSQLETQKRVIRPMIDRRFREEEKARLERLADEATIDQDSLKSQHETMQEKRQVVDARRVKNTPGQAFKPADVKSLEEELDTLEKSRSVLQHETHKLEFGDPKSRVNLQDSARAPSEKDLSRQIKVAGAGGLGMFGILLFTVAFLEFRSRKVGAVDELAHGLGMNVIGTLPAIPEKMRRAAGSAASGEELAWQNQLNEAIDAVRTVLLHTARSDASLRVILVTSANSGEGKTSLASQLAASLSRAWKKTLLIDGDLRSPAAHTLFDVPVEPGFSEVLRGELPATDAVRATAFSRLWVLPAGNWDSHALQALAQENVRSLFEELKQQYDFIIVDSPPVLPVTDTLMLGQHVDAALFAILKDVSRTPAIYAAQRKLAPLGIRVLGAVLLGAKSHLGNRDYRYAVHKASAGSQ